MDGGRVLEVKPGCFDLGCSTVCNGSWVTSPTSSDYLGWEDLGVFVVPLFVFLFIFLDMCGHQVIDLPSPTPPGPGSPGGKGGGQIEVVPTTPVRKRIDLQIVTPSGQRTIKVVTSTPLVSLKRDIASYYLPPGTILDESSDDYGMYRVGNEDEEEELDLNQSLSEQGIDQDGMKLVMKNKRESTSQPSSPASPISLNISTDREH